VIKGMSLNQIWPDKRRDNVIFKPSFAYYIIPLFEEKHMAFRVSFTSLA
jgi:hypothetical protein